MRCKWRGKASRRQCGGTTRIKHNMACNIARWCSSGYVDRQGSLHPHVDNAECRHCLVVLKCRGWFLFLPGFRGYKVSANVICSSCAQFCAYRLMDVVFYTEGPKRVNRGVTCPCVSLQSVSFSFFPSLPGFRGYKVSINAISSSCAQFCAYRLMDVAFTQKGQKGWTGAWLAPVYLYKYPSPTVKIFDGAVTIYLMSAPGEHVSITSLSPMLFAFMWLSPGCDLPRCIFTNTHPPPSKSPTKLHISI